MGPTGRRVLEVSVGVIVVLVLIGLYISDYLTTSPGSGSAAAATTANGAQLYFGTVAASETTDAHPTWVSYYLTDSRSENWRHVTTYEVPAHSLVHVTVFQYDGQSGLRNPFIAQGRGILGN